MAICELRGVSRTYGEGETLVRALDDVTLSFAPGEFTVISGPSGSGKTTMLNLVGLLDAASSGDVLIDGENVAGLSEKERTHVRARRIGFIFQSFNLVPVLSAQENVELALELSKTGGDKKKLASEALAAVGLGELTHRKPTELSGGQQQRVAIARALVKGPSLVIADEPTANLDTKTGEDVLDIMRKLNDEQGVTFLFSTHDPMVMAHAKRVVKLRDGRIEADERRNGG